MELLALLRLEAIAMIFAMLLPRTEEAFSDVGRAKALPRRDELNAAPKLTGFLVDELSAPVPMPPRMDDSPAAAV